ALPARIRTMSCTHSTRPSAVSIPVLHDVIATVGRCLPAQRPGPAAIVGVNVIDPEIRVGVPRLLRVAQNGLRPTVDEGDLEGLRIAVENDRVERRDESAEGLRR